MKNIKNMPCLNCASSTFVQLDSRNLSGLMDRKAIGFELKESYYQQAKKNLNSAMLLKTQLTINF